MTSDCMFYFVFCSHPDGEYLPERNRCDLDRATTIKDIADGQFENISRVIECNTAESIAHDVTEDILKAADRWEEPVVCSSIDFTRDRNRDYRKQVA